MSGWKEKVVLYIMESMYTFMFTLQNYCVLFAFYFLVAKYLLKSVQEKSKRQACSKEQGNLNWETLSVWTNTNLTYCIAIFSYSKFYIEIKWRQLNAFLLQKKEITQSTNSLTVDTCCLATDDANIYLGSWLSSSMVFYVNKTIVGVLAGLYQDSPLVHI